MMAFPLLVQAQSSDLFPMVPGVPVVHSPKSSGIYRGTPSIAKLPTGELIASNDVFSDNSIANRTDIFISRDNGQYWSYKATVLGAVWSGLFVHNGKLYLMGADTSNGANFVIRCSTDKGSTWSAPTILIPGSCHGSSTPVMFANNRIYKAYEHHGEDTGNKWMSGNRSFIISAPQDADLMKKESWTVSDEIAKPAWIDGTGWLESNAVMGRDGKIKGISRLASIEGIYAGYYSLESDNKIEEGSARKIQFWGGASKFNIRYDPVTDRYWSLANYVPDVLQNNNVSAGGMRSILALTSSYDLEEWEVRAIVLASTDIENVGFQYVDFIFDGDDILFVSRTSYDDGMGGADNYHNSNFMTFHRITDYATATTPSEWQYLLPNGKWNGVVKKIDESDGKGSSKDNPILISHPGEMVYLSEQVYQGNTYENKYFKMINDLDLNSHNWLPIGWYMTMSNNRPFKGHFDGGGHRILNLKIGRNDDLYTSNGIWGYTLGGTISNLGVDGESNILVGGVCGGIVAYANATSIYNCYNKGNVTGTSQAGGILGYGVSNPSVKNCYNRGDILLKTTQTGSRYVGGILGYVNTGTLSNCYNTGSVSALSETLPTKGGIAGNFNGTPIACYYSSESVTGGNTIGTSLEAADMKTAGFVTTLNGSQNPSLWKADYTVVVNNGFPILAWQKEDISSSVSMSRDDAESVLWNVPNPADTYTVFIFTLEKSASVSLRIFDMQGQLVGIVTEGQMSAGQHKVNYELSALPSGIYLYRMDVGEKSYIRKMIVK